MELRKQANHKGGTIQHGQSKVDENRWCAVMRAPTIPANLRNPPIRADSALMALQLPKGWRGGGDTRGAVHGPLLQQGLRGVAPRDTPNHHRRRPNLWVRLLRGGPPDVDRERLSALFLNCSVSNLISKIWTPPQHCSRARPNPPPKLVEVEQTATRWS